MKKKKLKIDEKCFDIRKKCGMKTRKSLEDFFMDF
jgi:hypothetical protein